MKFGMPTENRNRMPMTTETSKWNQSRILVRRAKIETVSIIPHNLNIGITALD